MTTGPFSLWVQSSVPEPLARQIVKDLAASFNVQITPAQLREGACLLTAPDLAAAEARSDDARSAGASFQVVDAQGNVVRRGSGRRAPMSGATLLGLPSMQTPPPAAPAEQAAQPRRASLPGRGGAREEGDGFDLDNLDASSLMTLDGEADAGFAAGPTASRPAPAPRSAALPHPRGAGPSTRRGEGPLELERPSASGSDAFAPPDDGEPLSLAAPRAAPPPAAPAAPAPSAPPSVDPYEALPPLPAAARPAMRRSAQRTELPGFLLFGGRLRRSPRLRIIAGFLLALGLGAILPAWRASTVMAAQIEPARQQLSYVTAHGHLLAGQRGYRSPEEIMQYIAGVKRRNATYGVFMWIGCGGLLGFLWFRFT